MPDASNGADLVALAQTVGSLSGPALLVIGIVALGRGWVVRKSENEDVKRERDEARSEVKTMNDAIKDEVIPLVTRNLDLLKAIEPRIAPPSVNLRDPT